MTKTLTKQKQLVTKKQKEFIEFVDKNVMPFFAEQNIKFDSINPSLLQDEWKGPDVLITIPYGERMEPWFVRAINECYVNESKIIYIVCGAKVNTNAFHKYVFPLAESIAFVRRGKRPTCIIKYAYGCGYKAFANHCNNTIAYSVGCTPSDIDDYAIEHLLDEEEEE